MVEDEFCYLVSCQCCVTIVFRYKKTKLETGIFNDEFIQREFDAVITFGLLVNFQINMFQINDLLFKENFTNNELNKKVFKEE